MDGKRRFGAIRRLLPDATQKMLTQHLRELERDGIIARKVYPQVPPKVEYSLTAFGKTLQPLLREMRVWDSRTARGQTGKACRRLSASAASFRVNWSVGSACAEHLVKLQTMFDFHALKRGTLILRHR